MKIIHYDLFAGIGGFSYALDTIFHNYERQHIFCEWEAFPTAVLKKHWPDATYYGDIADLVTDTDMLRERDGLGEVQEAHGEVPERHNNAKLSNSNSKHELTLLTGGFPCQPFSHAGRRAGTSDDRYKWPEMFAVIQNVRPDWVIAENVRGLVTWNRGVVLETVCADLESEGYEVQPLVIPACAIGAPHRRDRVWIVAHTLNNGQGGKERGGVATPDSLPQEHRSQDSATREFERTTGNRHNHRPWEADWREVAFATCHDGVDDGLPRWMDGVTISASRHRKERLKACGNAIVLQVAMEIFKAIKANPAL